LWRLSISIAQYSVLELVDKRNQRQNFRDSSRIFDEAAMRISAGPTACERSRKGDTTWYRGVSEVTKK
jgi:hypothetical protein